MQFIKLYLPFIISLLTGISFIALLDRSSRQINLSLKICLGFPLGLAINTSIAFFCFLLFNKFQPIAIFSLNIFILILLLIMNFIAYRESLSFKKFLNLKTFSNSLPYIILIGCSWPLWYLCQFYAFGGWDAWQTWNLKAKILFLGGENWKNIFDPLLWRSSPHYPLMLPLTNVWGWSLLSQPNTQTPILVTYFIGLFTSFSIFSFLRETSKTVWTILPSLIYLTIPLILQMYESQYADAFFGYFLIACVFCIIQAKKLQSNTYTLLAGLFLGFMTFTKTEGYLSALILGGLYLPYRIWETNQFSIKNIKWNFYLTGAIAAIPMIIFMTQFSPGNQSMINGLISVSDPSTVERAQTIGIFYVIEFISPKWSFIWPILFISMFISFKRSFSCKNIIIPFYLLGYLLILTAYYYVNTYFEIRWWLQVTFYRLIFALFPLVLYWVVEAALSKQQTNLEKIK